MRVGMRAPRPFSGLALLVFLAALLVAPGSTAPQAGAAPLTRPNIVYVLTDDQTMESVARMPYVSSRTDWISFDRAYVNNALCCPSRATILTGLYDTHTRVGTNAQGSLLDDRQTMAVWLRGAGYQTGMFGKYLNQYPFGRGLYVPPGWNQWQVAYYSGPNWGIYNQYHWKLNANGRSQTFLNRPRDYMPTVLTDRLVSWIRTKASHRQRFFAMYTPTATHGPWRASPTRAGTMADEPVQQPPNFNAVAADQPAYLQAQPLLDEAAMADERRREWEAAASVDDTIRRIDTALRNAGVFDNTVLIFMTDNGYGFGSHRWERKRCEFNECGQTPMLIRYPGLAARHDAEHLVSNVDMASTIAALAGTTPPSTARQDGVSFLPLILGQPVASWRNFLLLHWPGGDMDGRPGRPDSMPQFWGVLGQTSDGGWWKYVELDTGERELYDEDADPYELDNRYGDTDVATVQAELAAELADLKADAGATSTLRTDMPVPGPVGPDVD